MTQALINFDKIQGPVYTGRPRGEKLRKELALENLDLQAEYINVSIPDSTYTITSSFFLGMFGPSVVKLGSSDAFFNKYHFSAKPAFMNLFKDYVERALQQKSLFQ